MHPIGIPCTRDCRRTGRTKTQEPRTPLSHFHPHSSSIPNLTGLGLDLGSRALGTLLADLSDSLALGGLGSELSLLGLLGSSLSLLLLLALLDGLGAGSGAGLGSDVALLLDHVERSTDDTTLSLDSAAGSLLGNLLRDTLAVLSAVEDGPCDTAGVLPLEEERLRLSVLESEDLAVATDVELTL
jgi:hypothetical protein